jgi:nitroreductase
MFDPKSGDIPMSSKSDVFKSMSTARSHQVEDTAVIPSPAFAANHLASFQSVLKARRSIRIYSGEPIPEAIMREALKEATLAPSSSNLQTYELYWVRDPGRKQQIAEACLGQPAATTAGELIVVAARSDLWQENLKKLLSIMTAGDRKLPASVEFYYGKLIPKLMQRGPFGLFDRIRGLSFFLTGLRKPTVRTPVSSADHRIFGHTQAALAAQTLMLSLTAHGYDTCPMGGFDAVRVKNALKLPARAEITMVISAGTRKPEGLYGPQIRLFDEDLIKEI